MTYAYGRNSGPSGAAVSRMPTCKQASASRTRRSGLCRAGVRARAARHPHNMPTRSLACQPIRQLPSSLRLLGYRQHLCRSLVQLNRLARSHQIGQDRMGYPPGGRPCTRHMTVVHYLPRHRSHPRKAQQIDDVIQPSFQQAQQILAHATWLGVVLVCVTTKLLLQHAAYRISYVLSASRRAARRRSCVCATRRTERRGNSTYQGILI